MPAHIEYNEYGEPYESEPEITILDTQTGETIFLPNGNGYSSCWWAHGNGSCDCNRHNAMHGWNQKSVCLGHERYLIVHSSSKWYSLDELNEGYPDELKKKYRVGEGADEPSLTKSI